MTYSGDTAKLGIVRLVHVDGAEGAKAVKELVRLEDAAHTSADPGVPVLGVRQDTAASLAGTDGDYTMPIFDASGRLHVNAGANALPTGAATAAKQDTGNTSVASIDTKTPALGQALAAASVPVVLTAAQITTLTPPTPQTDALTDTQLRATPVPVSGTVTANLAAGTNNIGDVDVLTVPADPFGANADAAATAGSTGSIQAKLRLLTSQLDAVKTAVETLDNAIAGSEMQVDVVGALPAGTNAIGKLAANSGVDIGDVTLTAGTAAVGKLLPPDIDITTHTNYAKKYYTNAGAVTDGIIWSPAAGTRWHIVALHIQVSAAATVTLEDDKSGGDEAIFKAEYAANGGEFLVFPEKYPLASGEDAADLIITTTAGNVYVTAVGYEI